ncbi:MAG TPA: ATP-binding protein [Candidatus Acidoferrum sp.]|jgi:hypothetical protein|nr:ATP-binding protein [Candidatus Acidoferrum sp.]
MESETDASWIIDTMPTKELFIDMLTRDIALCPATIDLVDNCADGAKRLRGDGSFNNLWARVEISSQEFRISDNCGGIPVEVARKYAFRFGRPPGAPSVKHSVGQFGVGMKRAIFKMGRIFRVESATPTSRFVVKVDVDKWASDPKWEFEFSEVEENIRIPRDEQGTTIHVEALHKDVAEVFGLNSFETELKNTLQSRLQDPIGKGLSVTVNQIPVTVEPLQMLADPRLLPASTKLRYQDPGAKPVVVKLYCGLGKSEDPEAAGWHIFCNGRLIVEGEKTEITGWGWKEDGLKIPGFHGQFNYLRGYAYFDCDDAGRLPWNTTKTGVNTDSAIYRATRLEMMKLMRPVVDFCNKLKEEKERKTEEADPGPLEVMVDSAVAKSVTTIKTRELFEMPKVKPLPIYTGPVLQRIQYDKPLTQVNEVKKALGVRSFVKVGEKTFDYFYKAEVGE